MHILFLTENFPPERNAPASRVYERACYWVRWGHRVTVVTSAPNFPEGKVHPGYRNRWYQVDDQDGIRVVRVKTFIAANEGVVLRTLDFMSFMVTAFFGGLAQGRPDVVVATSPQFFAAVGGCALAAVRRRPFVFELSDLWPASITAVGAMRENFGLRMIERLELFLYRRAAKVVALTKSFKTDLVQRGIPADKIAVVINGVDLSRYSPQPRDPQLVEELGLENRFVVGYIGTHGMAHALERVLDAAELLRDLPAVRFLFVGSGAARDGLVSEAARRALPNVVFVSAQPKERMPAYWSLCDLALVHLKDTPLFRTVIPSKLFEAMAMGRAILLAAPDGEAASIVRATGAGIVLAPEDPKAMADAIRSLHASPAMMAELAGKSLASAVLFTREKQARDMLNAIEEVTLGKSLPSLRVSSPSAAE
jgi:putative colanic acid biosynthesis glycosyltransferase WcaI